MRQVLILVWAVRWNILQRLVFAVVVVVVAAVARCLSQHSKKRQYSNAIIVGKVFRVSPAFDSTVSTGSSSSTFTSDCLVIIVLILKIVFPSLLTSCTIFISVGDCCSRLFLFVWRLLCFPFTSRPLLVEIVLHVSSSSCGDRFPRFVLFVLTSSIFLGDCFSHFVPFVLTFFISRPCDCFSRFVLFVLTTSISLGDCFSRFVPFVLAFFISRPCDCFSRFVLFVLTAFISTGDRFSRLALFVLTIAISISLGDCFSRFVLFVLTRAIFLGDCFAC